MYMLGWLSSGSVGGHGWCVMHGGEGVSHPLARGRGRGASTYELCFHVYTAACFHSPQCCVCACPCPPWVHASLRCVVYRTLCDLAMQFSPRSLHGVAAYDSAYGWFSVQYAVAASSLCICCTLGEILGADGAVFAVDGAST